ncbi:hypothetical protein E1212_11555 [Jiangella ureilytica]|uniref:Uncharacterized protein n=1 Tax=Jiangella ureilytica TaxID=2530374 RepID=A0A4R4RQ33_9ACTN|nr:hypothetical protein [Jiangella ureilytica]TDC51626.1 hypothetical protein E1212_11555 [Jiangella ureilytica]
MSGSMPAPRPALVRQPDGTVRATATHLSSLAVDETAVAKAVKKHKKKAHAGDDGAELLVPLSKRDRKRLRRKADAYGWTAEEAAAHVLRAWADD